MEMVGCRLSLRVLMRVLMIVSSYSVLTVKGEDCGRRAGGRLCPGGLCCSQWGWCGNTPDHCSANCQSQCSSTPTPPTPSGGVGSIVTASVFENMLRHRKDSGCQGAFYTYSAFIKAAQSYPNFGNVGSLEVRKREIAAFFGQTSHETTGGWATAPDGAFAWGYCFTEERNKATYCQPSAQWPCNGNKKYYGRGPIQLTWNYNYGPAGKAIGFDGLNNPEAVANNAIISFKTALWFWMTAQSPKPSCHDVMVGKWRPSNSDTAAGRQAGFGMVTNIINGGLECGKGSTNEKEQDRIGFFKRYCSILGVSTGPNLSCQGQRPYTVTSKTPQEEEAAAATTANNNNNNNNDDDDNDALIREVAEN